MSNGNGRRPVSDTTRGEGIKTSPPYKRNSYRGLGPAISPDNLGFIHDPKLINLKTELGFQFQLPHYPPQGYQWVWCCNLHGWIIVTEEVFPEGEGCLYMRAKIDFGPGNPMIPSF